jgi:hypothetical protein
MKKIKVPKTQRWMFSLEELGYFFLQLEAGDRKKKPIE